MLVVSAYLKGCEAPAGLLGCCWQGREGMGGVTRRQIAAAAAAAHLKTLGLEALRQFGACEALSLR